MVTPLARQHTGICVASDNSELDLCGQWSRPLKLGLSIHIAISLPTSAFSLPWLSSNTFGLEKGLRWATDKEASSPSTQHSLHPEHCSGAEKAREEQRQEGFGTGIPMGGCALASGRGSSLLEDWSPSYRKIGGWMT